MCENVTIPIERLGFSTRTYNCLRREKINTVEQLMNASEAELMKIRNLGKKSLDEIIETRQKLTSGEIDINDETISDEVYSTNHVVMCKIVNKISEDYNNIPASCIRFYDRHGLIVRDVHVDDLKLSVRSTNCLINNNIEFMSQLINLDYKEFCKFRNIGVKSIDEILEKLKNICVITDDSHAVNNECISKYADAIAEILKNHFAGEDMVFIKSILKDELFNNFDELEIDENLEDMQIPLEIRKTKYVNVVCNNTKIRQLIKKHVIAFINEANVSVPIFTVKQRMPKEISQSEIANTIINEMVDDKQLEYNEAGLRIYYPSVLDYIDSLKNDKEKFVLTNRLKGLTLEDIGKLFDVTLSRERIRQISSNALYRRPRLREDDYKGYFEKYLFYKEDFTYIFGISDIVFYYLNMVYEKGTRPLEDLVEDESATVDIRNKADKYLYRNYIAVGNKRIKPRKVNLWRYVVQNYCKSDVSVDEFETIYYEFLKENQLDKDDKYALTKRNADGNLPLCNFLLWKNGKWLRYYDMNEYDMESFVKNLNLGQFQNIEISTLKLFRDNTELMHEYDIRDEYELHNLLKKIPESILKVDIEFGRMPIISFGNANRDEQIFNLLLQLAPVSTIDLGNAYEEEYGVRHDTAMGTFFRCIDAYHHNMYYTINQELFEPYEAKALKEQLKKEFYFTDDVKKIYLTLFRDGDVNKINAYNMKNLGFKVNSNCMFSNKYNSIGTYFAEFLNKDDIIDLNEMDSRFSYQQSFYSVLQELRTSLNLLEFSPNKFVNFRRLQNASVTKEELDEFINMAVKMAGDEYFTVQKLRNSGMVSDLDRLGFDDWFYSSLIRIDENIKFRKVGGTILFKRCKDQIALVDFFEYLLGKLRAIDIFDFMEYVEDRYGIDLDRFRIQDIIKNSDMHFDPIMERVYINYDEYYEEI